MHAGMSAEAISSNADVPIGARLWTSPLMSSAIIGNARARTRPASHAVKNL